MASRALRPAPVKKIDPLQPLTGGMEPAPGAVTGGLDPKAPKPVTGGLDPAAKPMPKPGIIDGMVKPKPVPAPLAGPEARNAAAGGTDVFNATGQGAGGTATATEPGVSVPGMEQRGQALTAIAQRAEAGGAPVSAVAQTNQTGDLAAMTAQRTGAQGGDVFDATGQGSGGTATATEAGATDPAALSAQQAAARAASPAGATVPPGMEQRAGQLGLTAQRTEAGTGPVGVEAPTNPTTDLAAMNAQKSAMPTAESKPGIIDSIMPAKMATSAAPSTAGDVRPAASTAAPSRPTVDWGGEQTVRQLAGPQTLPLNLNDPAFAGAQGAKISFASTPVRPGVYFNVLVKDAQGRVVKTINNGDQGSGTMDVNLDGLPKDGQYTIDVDTNAGEWTAQRNPRTTPTAEGAPDPGYQPGPATPTDPRPTTSTNPLNRPNGAPPLMPGTPGPTGENPATRNTGGTTPGTNTATGWTPATGIIDNMRRIDPATVDSEGYNAETPGETERATANGYRGTGYNAQLAPGAEGYNAETGEAATVDENLSGAIDRIIGQDGRLMQRAAAQANAAAQARGLGNSSMAVGAAQTALLDKASEIGAGDVAAAQFNAQQRNQMTAFNAEARNTAAQFLAAARNQNGQFNAQQANEASRFSAEAANRANEFEAAAQNTASMFNSGEANRSALAAVEHINNARRFAAEAENAARSQNAEAFNSAMQRYADAVNAALAAQQDAENQARRDGAQNRWTSNENALERQSREGMQERQIAGELERFGMQLGSEESRFVRQMNASQFQAYQGGMNALMQQEMEPAARASALRNFNAIWAASGYLPFDIDLSAFPAGNANTNTNTGNTPGTPPPTTPAPGANPLAR